MENFTDELKLICKESTAFIGIGNTDRSDDGAGIVLARFLQDAGFKNVFIGGITPEKVLPQIRDGKFANVVFLDAVESGSIPGSVVILDAQEIAVRFPQVSTHKLSVSMLAKIVSEHNDSRVWLLGIQPAKIDMSENGLSAQVDESVQAVAQQIVVSIMKSNKLQEKLCS